MDEAAAHHKAGRLREALDLYQRVLSIDPDYPVALNLSGVVKCQLGDVERGMELLAAVLTLKPDYAEASHNLGVALKKQGKLKEAEVAYRRATEIRPDYAAAHHDLGIVLKKQGKYDEAVASYRRALEIQPGNAEAQNNLGVAFHKMKKLEEAAETYRRALEVRPEYADAGNNLAIALADLGRLDDALEAYRDVLEYAPGDAKASHMVAAFSGTTTETAPREYVERLFDDYAGDFDHHLTHVLGYRTPELMRHAVDRFQRLAARPPRFHKAIDLGCGTGLVGSEFKDIVSEFHGVDVSANMVAEAERKPLYDAIHVMDALDFLTGPEGGSSDYDLVLAADVFTYIGDLAPIFAAVEHRLVGGGLFVFSVESAEGDSYVLRPTGRYAHSDDYIRRVALECGFTVQQMDRGNLRRDKDLRVEGLLFILGH